MGRRGVHRRWSFKIRWLAAVGLSETTLRDRLRQAWHDEAKVDLTDAQTALIKFFWRYRIKIF